MHKSQNVQLDNLVFGGGAVMDKELFEVVENLVAFKTETPHIEVVGFVDIGNIDDRLDEFFGDSFVETGDEVVAVHKIDGLALD